MSRLEPELQTLIGEEALIRLAEAFGGTRLYIPTKMGAKHAIARAIGLEAAQRMTARLAPDTIAVPLARDLRARHYVAQNRTAAEIARALGITERGVERLLVRIAAKPAASDQLTLL